MVAIEVLVTRHLGSCTALVQMISLKGVKMLGEEKKYICSASL